MKKLNTTEKLLEKSCNEAKERKLDLIKTKLNVRLPEDKTCYENRTFFNRDTKELFGFLRLLCKEVNASEIHRKSRNAKTSAVRANIFNPYNSSIWLSFFTETNVRIPSAGSKHLHFNRKDIQKHSSGVGRNRSKERDRKSELVLRSTYQIFEWDRNNSDRNFYNVVRYVHIPLVP